MHFVTDKRSYVDVVQLLFGVGLFATPWLFAYTGVDAAAWHAWGAGIVIAGLAGMSLAMERLHYPVSWATLAVGLWAIVAPWLVGFAAVAAALWSHVAIGALVTAIAILGLMVVHYGDSRVSA